MTNISPRGVVALLTDFGSGDGDVGVMKGVIAGIAPAVHLIDITHDVAAQNIASAAWLLASAYRYFPAGTVFVCVVDPGVGSTRRAVALSAGDWFFVGPDNGLFSYVINEQHVRGAAELTNPAYRLPQTSSTFHGRDIFAPAGAYLARDADLFFSQLGPALDPTTLVTLPALSAKQRDQAIEAHVLHVDHFGNLITSIPLTMVPELFTAEGVRLTFPQQGVSVEQRRRFFAEGTQDGQAFIYGDSAGYVGIAVRDGSAASTLGVGYSAAVILSMGHRGSREDP